MTQASLSTLEGRKNPYEQVEQVPVTCAILNE